MALALRTDTFTIGLAVALPAFRPDPLAWDLIAALLLAIAGLLLSVLLTLLPLSAALAWWPALVLATWSLSRGFDLAWQEVRHGRR